MTIYEEDLAEVRKKYPEATEYELRILYLREDSYSYGAIQKLMGNPSKKEIRQILLKFNPELIDVRTF